MTPEAVAIDETPRSLSEPEKNLVRWLLRRDDRESEAPWVELDHCLVRRYDASECLLFIRFEHSDTAGGTGRKAYFDDVDGVGCTAFIVYDATGRIRELDLWKGDDSPLREIPNDFR